MKEQIYKICTQLNDGQIAVTEATEQLLDLFAVSGSLPIEEVALHAADDWFDTAKFRSDVKADLKSYYEGYRDAMRFCQGNDS